jgi:hypothetical protein
VPAEVAASGPAAAPAGIAWARETASPRWAAPGPLQPPACSRYEAALTVAARAIAERRAEGSLPWEISEIVARLRAEGSPLVWPRVWSLEGAPLDPGRIEAGLAEWLADSPSLGQRRCGIAQTRSADGREVVVAVSVDALADLDPLPVRSRLGQWLRLRARLLAPARSAEIVLLGPRGAPRSIPTELRPGEARAVFSLDQMGLWRIQLLLDTDAGPRPALEAWAFVDAEPSLDATGEPAPGESLERSARGAASDTLLDMLNAARRSEQRRPLRRDARLDELARAHAEAMRRSRRTAHDVGDGSPAQRVEQAGFDALRIGENVAHARSLGRAHRALWESPAHRGNLLDPGFAAVGLGVVVVSESDAKSDGERENAEAAGVWVCELFAN